MTLQIGGWFGSNKTCLTPPQILPLSKVRNCRSLMCPCLIINFIFLYDMLPFILDCRLLLMFTGVIRRLHLDVVSTINNLDVTSEWFCFYIGWCNVYLLHFTISLLISIYYNAWRTWNEVYFSWCFVKLYNSHLNHQGGILILSPYLQRQLFRSGQYRSVWYWIVCSWSRL